MARYEKLQIWNSIDWTTVMLYFILVTLGWFNIYSVVSTEGGQETFEFSSRYGKQLLWIFAAVGIIITTLIIDSKFYTLFAYFFYAGTIVLLVAVIIFGTTVNGATSWFQIGGLRIQPAEFAKFSTALAIAHYLSKHNLNPKRFSTLITFAAIALFPSLLILMQNDTGSALVFFSFFLVFYREGMPPLILLTGVLAAILFVLSLLIPNHWVIIIIQLAAVITFHFLYKKNKYTLLVAGLFLVISVSAFIINKYVTPGISVSTMIISGIVPASLFFIERCFRYRLKHGYMILIFLFGSIAFSFSVNYVFNSILDTHQQNRINNLLGIESDPFGTGYNVNQSKIAIGSGGPWGKGYLNGTQTKFKFVPEQSTDFIFCTVGEEWGFAGTTVILLLFLFLMVRIIILAERQKSKFARIYGYSVAIIIFFHVAINVGMTIGLAPVIGIPLPFFSYGGSSLWGFTLLLFVFLKFDTNRNELIF